MTTVLPLPPASSPGWSSVHRTHTGLHLKKTAAASPQTDKINKQGNTIYVKLVQAPNPRLDTKVSSEAALQDVVQPYYIQPIPGPVPIREASGSAQTPADPHWAPPVAPETLTVQSPLFHMASCPFSVLILPEHKGLSLGSQTGLFSLSIMPTY